MTLSIAQSHRNVAQQSLSLCAKDRTAAKAAPKLFLIQRQQRNQIGRIKPCSRAVCLFHGRSSLYVIRTDLLTDVTAKNMISHERTKITRNKAFELNRQIGNAASRIQHVGSHESSGGAGFQTEIALSTAIADRPIVGERYAEKKFSQKKPRAVLGRNEMSIFADPADTRDAGKFPLQDRTRIHKDLAFHGTIADPSNHVEKKLQLVLY